MLAFAGLIVVIAGFVAMIMDPDYGILGHAVGGVAVVVIGGVILAAAAFLIWAQWTDTAKQTDISINRVEPPVTKNDKNGNEVETDWTRRTRERTQWVEDHHH